MIIHSTPFSICERQTGHVKNESCLETWCMDRRKLSKEQSESKYLIG